MDLLIRTAVKQARIPLIDAVYMASTLPARIMGIQDTKGAALELERMPISSSSTKRRRATRFVMHRGRVVRGERNISL